MSNSSIFRSEAVEHHLREPGSRGVIEASPTWTWFILAASACLIIAAALFLSFTTIDVPVRTEGMVRQGKGGAEVVAYPHVAAGELRQGQRVRIQLIGSMHAGFESFEGRIARIQPIGEPAASGSVQALIRIDIDLDPPANGPLASTSMHDGMPVRVLLTSRKVRLITLIHDSLL